MLRVALGLAFVVAASALSGAPASAQSDCRPFSGSCTKMYETCKAQCANSQNPARCEGSTCAQAMPECQSSGIWRSRASRSSCWKVSSKS